MGVYIRGMEMPKNCMECPLKTDYGTCGYYSLYVEAGHESDCEKRRDDCPLIELPPHGRLIDADAMITSIKKQTDFLKVIGDDLATIAEVLEKGFLQEIENAPTIIEAEDGEI